MDHRGHEIEERSFLEFKKVKEEKKMDAEEEMWDKFLDEKSDEELKGWAIELHDSIFNRRCYGVARLCKYEIILEEMERRGYGIEERSVWEVKKEKEEG